MSAATQIVTPNNLTPLTYVLKPGEVTVQFSITGNAFAGATGQFQGSNDGTNWATISAIDLSTYNATSTAAPAANTPGSWVVQAIYQQYRFVPQALQSGQYAVQITGLFQPLSNGVIVGAMLLELRRVKFALGALIETDLAEAVPN